MVQERFESTNQSTNQSWTEHSDEFVLLSSGKSAWDGILLEHLQRCLETFEV